MHAAELTTPVRRRGSRGPAPRPPVRTRAERDALVLAWLDLPGQVAHGLRHHPAVARLGRDDARAEAALALVRAAELWQPGRGSCFPGYARAKIRYHLLGLGREAAGRPTPLRLSDRLDPATPPRDGDGPACAGPVGRAVDALPWGMRAAVVGVFWQGRTMPELARARGVTPSCVDVALRRALAALRRALAPLGPLNHAGPAGECEEGPGLVAPGPHPPLDPAARPFSHHHTLTEGAGEQGAAPTAKKNGRARTTA